MGVGTFLEKKLLYINCYVTVENNSMFNSIITNIQKALKTIEAGSNQTHWNYPWNSIWFTKVFLTLHIAVAVASCSENTSGRLWID